MDDTYQIGPGPLRLFVLGATGGNGTAIIEQALAHGHRVTAFVRSPEKITRTDERLTVVGGDVRDARALAAAMRGHDAVVTTLGPRSKRDATLLGEAGRATVTAMKEAGVRRIVAVSAALLYPDANFIYVLFRRFFTAVIRDCAELERAVEAGDLDFTIVRPPRLMNGKGGREVRVAESGPPSGMMIDRADLASFLLDVVEHDRYPRRVVGVSR
jgi:putative NADH-flavin reductase